MREIWRGTTLAWNTLRAALLPFAVADLAEVTARFLTHLRARNDRWRRPRVFAFLDLLRRHDG